MQSFRLCTYLNNRDTRKFLLTTYTKIDSVFKYHSIFTCCQMLMKIYFTTLLINYRKMKKTFIVTNIILLIRMLWCGYVQC